MSDPQLQSQGQGDSLWEQAPGWRNLVIGATLLTATALALPLIQQNSDDPPRATPSPPHHAVAVAVQTPAPTPAPVLPHPVTAPRLASLAPAPQPVTPAPAQQPAASQQACLLTMQPAPQGFGEGMVMSFEDHATSLARIQFTQARAGGQIDPDYVDNQRVTVKMGNGNYQVFLVPRTMQVHAGDRVTFQGGYRNLNLPCNYIPNLITADLGQAPAAPASQTPP